MKVMWAAKHYQKKKKSSYKIMETAGLEVQHISLVDKEFIREVIAYCLKKKDFLFLLLYSC